MMISNCCDPVGGTPMVLGGGGGCWCCCADDGWCRGGGGWGRFDGGRMGGGAEEEIVTEGVLLVKESTALGARLRSFGTKLGRREQPVVVME